MRPLSRRRREQAREARAQWLRAIAEGRDHGFIEAKWSAYRAMAGREIKRIEAEYANA